MLRTSLPESRENVNQLAVSWLLMIPLIFCASQGRFWFQSVASDNPLAASAGSLATQGRPIVTASVTAVVFSIVAFLAFPYLERILNLSLKAKLLLTLLALAALSCIWSQIPFRSFSLSLSLAMNIVLVLFLYIRFAANKQLELLYMLGWVCLILSYLFVAAFPQYGISHLDLISKTWRGIYPAKNPCGDMTVFLLTVCFFIPMKSIRAKCFRAAYIFLSIVLIAASRSTTSYILLLFLLAFVVSEQVIRHLRRRDRPVVLVLLVTGATVILVLLTTFLSEIAYLVGKDPTLSGRTGIWLLVIGKALKHPLLGYGFGAFWDGYQGESMSIVMVSHWAIGGAHNGFLETWLSLGLAGVSLLILLIVKSIRDAIVSMLRGSSAYISWCICIVFLTVIYNVDEAASLAPNHLAWMMFMLASVGLSERTRTLRQEQTIV